MTRIVQIAPTIEPGSGVAGVAYALEQEFRAAGVHVERFTAADAGRTLVQPHRTRFGLHLARAGNVIWFSTVGTRRAKRFLAARPDAVSFTHNDVMAGDVYVNHGLLQAAMRARGNYAWRMVRNPVHLFTALRDRIRYRGRTHRAVVALTGEEARLLTEVYGRVRPRSPSSRTASTPSGSARGCRGAGRLARRARHRARRDGRDLHRARVRTQGPALRDRGAPGGTGRRAARRGRLARDDQEGRCAGPPGGRRRSRGLRR
ncbi:hypothetical protein GCM10025870_19820 [Agromyces marinus]|uniref:Glycosyltransferase subfamily 4-like N-terminal domain-containing protein n=1 Tax=Agromyces marinus TaxID=1389020 RepID=A0ABN0HIB0_9MICO|nr:hypothetical protein GCM10025870_19820 [Agromyces marinus]